MADLRISDLPELSAGLQGDDPIAIVDLSASTTKKIKAGTLVLEAIQGLPDDSIPIDKVNFSGVPPGSIGTTELADGSVTAAKLANQSATTISGVLPASGDFTGQIHVLTGDPVRIYSWNGTTWVDVSNLVAVEGDTSGLVNTYVATSGDTATVSADIDNTTGSGQFLAGPASGGGAVSQRQIVSTDLPTAGSDKGAVAVNGNGLAMSGATITIDNSVGANSGNGRLVQYNAKGLVTGGAEISAADLPLAESGNVGAVQPGPGLSVDATGTIGISNSVVGGTFPKITFNDQGLCTAGQSLIADDVPNLDASKITTGDFGTGQISDDAITSPKLSDFATCLMQEATPQQGDFLGQLWFQPSIARLSVYARGSGPQNIWQPAGLGNLQGKNLRWGGTINATTSKLVTLTDIGVSEGLAAGDAIPEPSDEFSGLYFVVQTAGNQIDLLDVTGQSFDEGDWLLCIGTTAGYIRINVAAGGGGGGGATRLNQLTDVFIENPENSDLLQFDSTTAIWGNVGALDGGSF